MLETIAELADKGESFAFETTLAGRTFAKSITRWQRKGYYVTLLFLSLPSPQIAVERVAQRVRQGGHDVPESVVRRRFTAGLRNFKGQYRDLVDMWAFYDNSGPEPMLQDWGMKSQP
jgi:predicted ABC-type ATPase